MVDVELPLMGEPVAPESCPSECALIRSYLCSSDCNLLRRYLQPSDAANRSRPTLSDEEIRGLINMWAISHPSEVGDEGEEDSLRAAPCHRVPPACPSPSTLLSSFLRHFHLAGCEFASPRDLHLRLFAMREVVRGVLEEVRGMLREMVCCDSLDEGDTPSLADAWHVVIESGAIAETPYFLELLRLQQVAAARVVDGDEEEEEEVSNETPSASSPSHRRHSHCHRPSLHALVGLLRSFLHHFVVETVEPLVAALNDRARGVWTTMIEDTALDSNSELPHSNMTTAHSARHIPPSSHIASSTPGSVQSPRPARLRLTVHSPGSSPTASDRAPCSSASNRPSIATPALVRGLLIRLGPARLDEALACCRRAVRRASTTRVTHPPRLFSTWTDFESDILERLARRRTRREQARHATKEGTLDSTPPSLHASPRKTRESPAVTPRASLLSTRCLAL